jgi:hypothetical protein
MINLDSLLISEINIPEKCREFSANYFGHQLPLFTESYIGRIKILRPSDRELKILYE